MLKVTEKLDRESCFNRALDGEAIFVLLARDITAPETIRFWVRERIMQGKNKEDDAQIVEALNCALLMERQYNSLPPSELWERVKENQLKLFDKENPK